MSGFIKRLCIFIGNVIAMLLLMSTFMPIMCVTMMLSLFGYLFFGYDPNEILDKGFDFIAWPIELLDKITGE